jgi:TonB-dependent receptor
VPFNGDFEDQSSCGGKGSTNHQKEETLAAYGLLRFGHDVSLWGDQREIDGNFGIRVVKTESQSQGLQVFTPNTSSPNIPAADQAFSNGAKSPYKGGRDYVNVLPSLNVRLKITPDMFIRFAAAKAIVRPDFQQLQPNYSIGPPTASSPAGPAPTHPGRLQANCVYQYTANAGNPDLKPTRSTQFDLSYEWYFNSTGSVTATAVLQGHLQLHHQRLDHINFTNNGVTRPVQVIQPYNAGHGKIKGFEVAYQQYYDFLPGALRGLGAQANFTYVDSKGSRNAASNPYDTNQTGNISAHDDEMPLEGLSKTSYNVAALYDLGKVSARLAYNWRERYLLTTTAANINIPAWYDDYGQLDGSVFYTVNDALKIGFQAANLTNSRTKILVSYPGRPKKA